MLCAPITESTTAFTLPDNTDPSVVVGCKQFKNIPKFHDTTAGFLTAVKPCGVIISFTELYTMESCTQVFAFLLHLAEQSRAIKCVVYDRGCELHPFLKNLAKIKKNPGAQKLLDTMDFMVDIFHVKKHTRLICMPPPDSIPELSSTFINGNFRAMSQHKFYFYLHCVIKFHNVEIMRNLQGKLL